MKKGLLKAGVLLLLFAAALGGTAALINREKIVGTRQMEDASLPILYMEVADTKVNPMYGYASEMEEQYMRDSLTPLPTDRSLTMAIDPKNASVKTVSYRVSTADGTEVVETSKISKLKKKDGEIRAEFQLETPILMNQEYTLRFDVTLDNGETYYYYTRLLQRAGTNISEYLEFADSFYQTCLDSENASTLAAYLEPDETQTNSTYENLNIHSSFERITWGTLDMKLEKKAVPVIKDMNETTCSIYLTYVLSDTPEDETTDYYNVTDFYRMRYAQSRVMLLDFDRNTQELYDGKHTELTSKGINLGVVAKDVQYQSNKSSDIVAFVQEGELWSYNRSANKTKQVEEELFIPMKSSYEYLKEDMELLSYVTRDDMLYVILEDDLYQIDIKQKSFQIVKEKLIKDRYVVSKSQASLAWMDQEEENACTQITVMSLEQGDTYTIQAQSGQKIKALGFMNEDLVYGIANDSDIVTDNAGNTVFAMNTVRIEQFGGEVVKEHHEDNVWVSNVKLQEGLLELERVQWENGAYVAISSDHIMNNLQIREEQITLRLITTERKATQIGLDFEKSVTSKNVLYLASNLEDQETYNILSMELTRTDSNIYYVYAKGVLDSTWSRVCDAINRADGQMGVVLNRQQQYVWERGNRQESYQANLDEVPDVVLSGTIDENTLQQSLGADYTVMNLTGCSLDSVLYQVSKGNPVIAKVSDTVNVVIIGYNSKNTILYYPATQEQGYFGMQDSTSLFESAGNVFVGYMDNLGAASKSE